MNKTPFVSRHKLEKEHFKYRAYTRITAPSLKDRKLLINAIYLELPTRINALMWIMTTALLIYTATEYLMRKKMKEQRLSIPSPDHKKELENRVS